MRTAPAWQPPLLAPEAAARFPSTRYQGSKAKLAEWIWEQLADLDFVTCLDAFGGTGAVAYRLKQAGKQVTYNDLLRCNYYFGVALIANRHTRLSPQEVNWLLEKHPDIWYPSFVQDTFPDIYFTDTENAWIDQTITNLRELADPYKFALGFFALCQACLVKRPYNLFHRKNLYLRLAQVARSFGNKAAWDRPFPDWFRLFAAEVSGAVFDNGRANGVLNIDYRELSGEYDLVYLDPPYISSRGGAVDYRWYYHFLEGLTMYEDWGRELDRNSRHRRLKPQPNDWLDKQRVKAAFRRLFETFQKSIIVVSYRSDGIPGEGELALLLEQYKPQVEIRHYGRYQYALSTNAESREILLIGT